MLTTHRKDEIIFLGTTYNIFAVEDYETFFDPREHGIFVYDEVKGAGRSYHCSYYVQYKRLILEGMYYPRWLGGSKRAANLFIPYTGGLLIGGSPYRSTAYERGFRKAIYKRGGFLAGRDFLQTMAVLKFNEGALKKAVNLGSELRDIKEAVSEMEIFKKENPSSIRELYERREVYEEIAKEFFSAEYIIIGAGRLLWDEMVNSYNK